MHGFAYWHKYIGSSCTIHTLSKVFTQLRDMEYEDDYNNFDTEWWLNFVRKKVSINVINITRFTRGTECPLYLFDLSKYFKVLVKKV